MHETASPSRPPDLAARRRLGALALLRAAVGGPTELRGKGIRLGRTLRLWLNRGEVERRLERLRDRGLIDEVPNRAQLWFGGVDMLRFMIEPAAREYYEQQGISFGFHQLLRVLDDPVSMIDPTGFFSDRDTIVGHVMQVVHLNPVYDLQLMEMWDDGLEDFERQVGEMVDGIHPRSRSIGAIVEDPGYHARLLGYIRRYRDDPTAVPPIRDASGLRADPHFAAAERTFHTLPGFLAYAAMLPPRPGLLVRRLRTIARFPLEMAPD